MRCCGFGFGDWRQEAGSETRERRVEPQPGGSPAFDEYRAEMLRRLEEEQREFCEFLAHLRMAKDKAEFDQFMAERRGGAQAAPRDPPSA